MSAKTSESTSQPIVEAFEWDRGNREKNWFKHRVKISEAEEVFFDSQAKSYPDPVHSTKEARKIIVGKTSKGRVLFVVYTIRDKRVRVISARDINKQKEAKLYEEAA